MFQIKRYNIMECPSSMEEGPSNEGRHRNNGLYNENVRERMKQNCVALPGGGDLEYLTFPLLDATGLVRHLFTTRLGGVSEGEFASMNFSVDRGDSERNVAANYERIAGVLGCGVDDMVTSHQTHTVNIRKVTSADRGKGIVRPRDYENVDGLMTNERGIVLVTFYADCVPLFFVDVKNRAVGLAHSGWRGTAAGMGRHMVDAMRESYGTAPKDLRVCIGPSICRDCYEVGEDVAVHFMETGRPGQNVIVKGDKSGKYYLDLWLANRLILENAGVCRENIAVTDICTCHNSVYLFSHRASGGKRGNMGAFLGLL